MRISDWSSDVCSSDLLRCIAGFERPDSGRISLGDRPLSDIANVIFVPPNTRHFGMVFQCYAVWPHMTVTDNVGYPLTVQRGLSRTQIGVRVGQTREMVRLGGLEARQQTHTQGAPQTSRSTAST